MGFAFLLVAVAGGIAGLLWVAGVSHAVRWFLGLAAMLVFVYVVLVVVVLGTSSPTS